jgi:hypothetical protein
MSFLDAVRTAGLIPAGSATRAEKKRYAEALSRELALARSILTS